MTSPWDVLRVCAACAALTTTGAAVTALAFPADARDWLDLRFPGVPATSREALDIFATNARLLSVPVIATALLAGPVRPLGQRPVALARAGLDALLLVLVLLNLGVIAVALGAYGPRMLVALLPHGPVELLAFSCALTAYLHARRGAFAVVLPLAGYLALAAAAVLETFA